MLWRKKQITPARIIIVGFALLILTGTLLLMLPISTKGPGGASFLDALFTATSATCVTGLIVQDTALYWTTFGQFIIILLIQIGGMGVVTVAVAVAVFFRKENRPETALGHAGIDFRPAGRGNHPDDWIYSEIPVFNGRNRRGAPRSAFHS